MGNKDKPKDELLSFDWNCLPFWSDYAIAQDEDKRWWCYDESPKLGSLYWTNVSGEFMHIQKRFAPTNYNGDWKDSLRINPKYIKFDWNCLPPWCDYAIAQDEDKRWWCYDESPKLGLTVWLCTPGKTMPIHKRLAPANYSGDWEDSLRINPKYKNREVPK